MDPFLFVAPIFGVMLGTLLVSRVGSWLVVVSNSVKRKGKVAPGEVATPASSATAIFLHSGPWLLVAICYLAYYVLSAPHAPGWSWFFGGVAASPILWAPVFWSFRRPHATSPAEAASKLEDRPYFRFARWLNVKRNYDLFCVLTTALPMSVFLTISFFDAVRRAPELFVIFLAGSIVLSLIMSTIVWNITHPKPWRIPPSKQP